MKPIVFHLADSHMEGGFRSFFRRDNWHYVMECERFPIDPESAADIYRVPTDKDPGLWQNAHENLSTHLKTHERAVIILDEYFGGSPGAKQLREDISSNMLKSGWDEDRFEVVVIEPMLEAWLWADNVNVARAFGFDSFEELQAPLIARGFWQRGAPKPIDAHQKDAKELAIRLGKSKMGASVFRKLFEKIS